MATTTTKGLSLNEMRTRVAKFVVDYKDVTKERQNTGDFWRAFMRCYGVEDSFLQGVTFEYPARRSDTGGGGFIDVFLPGRYLIEQKSGGKLKRPKGAERSNAEEQADAYLTGGDITENQMPRYVVTSDFASIQVTDLKAPRRSPTRTKTVPTADLVDHVELFLFLAGGDTEALIAQEQAEASVAAARLMGDLYAAMTGDDDTDGTEIENPEDEDATTMEASILLTRLLFLMFGDDAGLWSKGLFLQFLERRTVPDGSDLGAQLNALFSVLNTPEPRDKRMDEALREFPHVNGALFHHDDTKLTWFDKTMRDALIAACKFDWARISPAVFGSLFQTVKNKEARREAGEHYTSEANILKLLRPMFIDDLRTRLDAANTKPALEALHTELKSFRYVDPACGCGNFLIVAYREMRALELDLLVKLQTKRGKGDELILDPSDMLNVRLDQFYGIELHWWPAKIAQVAMFLVDHQANQQMAKVLGYTPNRLPIGITANIHHTNAITSDWKDLLPGPELTTYIFGNPPFVGYDDRTDDQRTGLQTAWNTRSIGRLDYVTAWHAKAIDYYGNQLRGGDFAFVSTNSIAQGEPVPLLFKPLFAAGWRIKFAHTTFEWTTEAPSRERAFVHCIIVGFTLDTTVKQRLYTYTTPRARPVEQTVRVGINAYLVDAPHAILDKRRGPLAPGLPPVKNGCVAGDTNRSIAALRDLDGLVMDANEADHIRDTDPTAARYLRPYVGGADFLNGVIRYCLWMPEGPDTGDLAASPELRRRLDNVRRVREASTEESTKALAATPYRFKHIAQPTTRYICMPRTVSERRAYFALGYLEPDHIVSNGSFWAEDPDGLIFAIGSSAMFMAWQKAVGGRIKSDPRFANTLVWNNFPLPDLTAAHRREVVDAGQAVLAARAADTGRTLAQEYDPLGMTPALVNAHRALDKAIDKAFGVGRGGVDDFKRQQTLFTRYVDLTAPTA